MKSHVSNTTTAAAALLLDPLTIQTTLLQKDSDDMGDGTDGSKAKR